MNEKTVLHPFWKGLGPFGICFWPEGSWLKNLLSLSIEIGPFLKYNAYNGGPSGHRYMHYTLKKGPRSLIVSPFFLPEPSRAFYKFGRVGKRSGAEGAAGNFLNFRAIADFVDLCTAVLGRSITILEGYLPPLLIHPALVFILITWD